VNVGYPDVVALPYAAERISVILMAKEEQVTCRQAAAEFHQKNGDNSGYSFPISGQSASALRIPLLQ
jgi:hypothetical protein